MVKSLKTIARPYARAIFLHATEQKTCEEWDVFLNKVSQIVLDKQVAGLLRHPAVSGEQLFELLLSILQEDVEESQKNFLHVLAVGKRLNLLPKINILFRQLQAEAQNVLEAEVTSAFALTHDQEQQLEDALKKRLNKEKVRLHCLVDSTILGGAIVRAGDLIIDGSGRGQLKKMEEYLM
jgi:F-type H+-transporting ATPase subunit delta